MQRFGKKDLIYMILLGICILTAAFFGSRSFFSEKKYEKYRSEVLTRSTEGSIQLLYQYASDGDGTAAPLICARLCELPFKEEEREAVILFCRHVFEGDGKPELERAAKSYAYVLAVQLEKDRELVIRGDMSTLPIYEGVYTETFWSEDDAVLKKARELLFSDSPAKYERTEGDVTFLCYRTGRGYAEFYGETLIKYLYEPKSGDKADDGELLCVAEKFAKDYFGVSTSKATSENTDGGTVFRFDGVCEITVTSSGHVRRAIFTADISDAKKEE